MFIKNYDLWDKELRTALKAKNKLGFIDGRITKPTVSEGEESTTANAWDMVNSMITSWIMNVIGPRLQGSIACVESTHEMWSNIQK